MAEVPDPAEVAARSERSARAEATPPHGVCATCRGMVLVRARYDDYWRTPLTLQDLRVTDMNGVVFDGDIRTQGLLNFGTADGEVSDTDIAALRDYLGSAEAADAQRGPLLVETIPDPAAAPQVADLERQILSDLRVFASRMETAIQPWIDDWERSGWFGALETFLGGLRDGAAAWVDGESEFWAGMWEWVSGLPDMLGEAWDDLSAGVRALWDNRHRIVELLQSLAEGAVDAFERGFAALLDALDGLPGIEELVELLRSLVIRSAEWAGAMIEVVRQTDVLRALTATALGVLVLIPPNFWAEVAGTGVGYLIPEAIIAILFLIVAAFTGGTGGAGLAARLVIFANNVGQRMRAAGQAGGAIVDMLDFLGGLVSKLTELVRKVMRNRRERATGQTDREVPIVRSVRRHDVPCFDLPRGADPAEFDRQLREQMDAINQMTADDMAYAHYVLDQARAEHARQMAAGLRPAGSSFTDILRDNGAQRSARQDYALDLENQGFDDEEISEIMSSVDATHFLDIVAGGNPSDVGIGGSAENRGIGRQWIREGRAESLGQTARGMRQDGLADRRMNVNLERCR
ncbi:polymorphic toxin type 15 domain-containing protein [Rhodovulum sulfidophilum]|uniref:Novel toxin 15 domain-containing protein n=1 Tax=Rhodovulum sulfidophilum TaxID=35806 RepID=A0ABS1RYQ3_RHOSU|nr:polymorphic toxin type 15 domain-containing protein [Rhodovulum sulfidophilum]MBL3611022.1 hypothetical protein [Rhodovulum sulfidophilum]MCE8455324.1 polymorphic toxin type 15 domain-containing protein [Rhodovulum sulfidophilum]